MRNKNRRIFAMLLSVLVICSNLAFVYAEDEIENIEEPQVEEVKKEEPQKEEVKKEEVKEEVKEEEVKEEIKEEEPNEEVQIEEPQEEVKEEVKEETELPNNIIEETQNKNTKVKLMASKAAEQAINITLIFTDIRQTNGTVKEQTQSNNISYGGSWGFLPNKFEKTTGLRVGSTSTYENRDYVYNGQWTVDDKETISATKTFRLYYKEQGDAENTIYLMQDTTLTLKPVWETIKYPGLEFYYTDNVSTGSGSWTNKDDIGYYDRTDSYSHLFTNPEDKSPTLTPDYQFQYWQLDEYYQNENRITDKEGEQYQSGSSFTYSSNGLAQGTKTVVNAYAYWQPAVKVYLHNGTEIVKTITSFDSINSADFEKLADTDTQKFFGWFDENGQLADIYNAPAITKEANSVLIIDLFAKFKEIVQPTDDPTDPVDPVDPTDNPKPQLKKTQPQVQPIPQTEEVIIASTNPPTTTIDPAPTPKAEPQGSWALINLIAAILSCICALVFLFVRKDTEDDEQTDDEKKDMRKMVLTKIASAIIGIGSIIIFILTENMSLPMVLTDKWTFLMILLLIIEIVNIFIIRQQSKGEENDDNN